MLAKAVQLLNTDWYLMFIFLFYCHLSYDWKISSKVISHFNGSNHVDDDDISSKKKLPCVLFCLRNRLFSLQSRRANSITYHHKKFLLWWWMDKIYAFPTSNVINL